MGPTGCGAFIKPKSCELGWINIYRAFLALPTRLPADKHRASEPKCSLRICGVIDNSPAQTWPRLTLHERQSGSHR